MTTADLSRVHDVARGAPRPDNSPGQSQKPARDRVVPIAIGLLLWGYAAVALGPLLLMLVGSLRESRDIFDDPLGLPTSLDVSNYRTVWADASFSTFFLNSVIVTASAVALGTVVSLLAAYPLGRYQFRGAGLLSAYFIAGMMLPIRLGIVPIFYLLASLGLVDSRFGLVLVYAASGIPFSVFVLSAFYRGLPAELEEAARIDGASEFRIFRTVMLPLVRPAIATVVLFQLVPLWNDFFFPLVLLRSTEKATIPIGLTQFFGQFQTDWAVLFAGLVVATVPLVLLFLVATKQIIAGLTAGMGK
jgi:raffinose/stachyose/melibiose transport system permease protein